MKIGCYADGQYLCKCLKCGIEFHGDKRATQCLPCAIATMLASLERAEAANDELKAKLADAEKNQLPNPLDICFGEGRIKISHFRSDVDWGVLMEDTGVPHQIGEYSEPYPDASSHKPVRGEIYLRFTNFAGLCVFAEELIGAIKFMGEDLEKRVAELEAERKGKVLVDKEKATELFHKIFRYVTCPQGCYEGTISNGSEGDTQTCGWCAAVGELCDLLGVQNDFPKGTNDAQTYYARQQKDVEEWDKEKGGK